MRFPFAASIALWLFLIQSATPRNIQGPGTVSQVSPPTTESVKDPTYSALRNLKISGDMAALNDGLAIRRDAGEFVFYRGEFHFTTPVDGKVVAAVFIGDGEFRMQPPIDVERLNLELLTKDKAIKERFSDLVLHFTDNTYDEITRRAPVSKGRPSVKAASILEDRVMLMRKGKNFSNFNVALALLNYNLPARLLADLHDREHAGFFNAFIKGKEFENLMFRIDPRGIPWLEPEEVALASFSDGDLGIWNSFHLQEHYLSKGDVADEDHHQFHVRHQQIDATIKGLELHAKVETTIDVLADGRRVLNFALHPTLHVTSVSEGDKALQFIQEQPGGDPDFAVVFPQPLSKGPHKIRFEYQGGGALVEAGAGNFTLVARASWYPSLTFGERSTYDMTFRIPKDFVMVASGFPQGSSQIGNELVTRWKSDLPLPVAGFNFGLFKKTEVRNDKLGYVIESYANTGVMDVFREVKELVLPSNFDTTRLMEKARNEAEVAIGIYQKYFGNASYNRLAMTQQPFFNFGQAWPMLVYMPVTAYLDSTTRNSINFVGAEDFFKILAPHEVAHQWWGHTLGWKSYRDQWMSEGFSEFSASLFAHLAYGDDQFLEFWKDQRDRIIEKNRMGKRPGDVASVTMGYRGDNGRTGNVAQNVIYPKGAFILHMIRMMMYDNRTGDQRFIAMMRDFVETHRNKNVSTEDFKRAVEKHMTADMDIAAAGNMDWFFNQFVYGIEIPRYKLTYQLNTSEGKTVLKMRVTQSGVSDSFRMAVPVYLELENKKLSKLGVVRLLGASYQDSTIPLGFRPKRVLLAAYEDVLATIEQ